MAGFGENSAACSVALNIGRQERVQASDDVFADLVQRQARFVFQVAFSVLRNTQDAEDVVQETFLKVYRSNTWNDVKDERAFLARAAWRLAVSRIQRRSHERLPDNAVDSTPNAEQTLLQEDSDARVHRLMDALPLKLRLPLALSTVDEMTSPEIAKVMAIAEGTVRTRLMRAREILRRKLMEGEKQRG